MGDIRIKDMPEVNMKNRITELLEQIQKDFQSSSENIGKIKGLLEDEGRGVAINAIPKPEINSYEDASRLVKVPYGNGYMLPDHLYQQVRAFEKRLTIAEALGARPFVEGSENFFAERNFNRWRIENYLHYKLESVNYFPTQEQAKKYLDICLKEGLL